MKHPNALPAGSVLSSGQYQYRVVKVLGSGGFGITYLVTSARKIGNITVNVRFAIKEHFLGEYCERDSDTLRIITGLGKQRETVENSMKDFLGEAKRLQRVGNGHPSIVKVNEVFEANGTAYYVMEYLEGKSLRAYVEEHGPLAEDDALRLLAPVAGAVDYLHSCRLTHLDIKPDNIIITEEENADGTASLRPVLIDFGLSKHYDDKGNATSTINILGCSDGYAPIEQYAGITKFSPAADVYAMAATLLFCLSGANPRKSTELIYADMPEYLAEAVPGMSDALKERLLQALSAVPDKRPASLAGLIPPVAAETPVKAAPAREPVATETTALTAAASRKRPALYIACAAVLLAVVAGLIFLTRGHAPAEEPLAPAADSTQCVADSMAALPDTVPAPAAPLEAEASPAPRESEASPAEAPVREAPGEAAAKTDGEEEFQKAGQYYDNNEYDIAVAWLEKAAEKGHPVAQNDLAVLCQHGIGTPINWSSAQKYYRQCGKGPGSSNYCRILNKMINQLGMNESDYLKNVAVAFPMIFFGLDESTLRRDDKLILKYVAHKMKSNPNASYLILASQPDFTGSAAVNQRILQQRAGNVQKYLISCGVSPSQLSTRAEMTSGIAENEAEFYSVVRFEMK